MKTLLFSTIIAAVLCLPTLSNAQAPDLGAASSFAVFTGIGDFTNTGATMITGDIGTNVGMFSGFPPGTVVGQIHVADPASAAADLAVTNAYTALDILTCGLVLPTPFGNGQILTPNVYCIGSAAAMNGTLILDAQGDPDAEFIFQIDGALSTDGAANFVLLNGASWCNIWWQVNGAFNLGPGASFQGNVLANGAINLLTGSSLIGRALATVGAVTLNTNNVTIGLPLMTSVISANTATTFCLGDSVVLSGNVDGTWSTGATTPTITVTTSGDYYVVNSTECESDTSNHILVTVNPVPVCTITGSISICEGLSTELCAGAGFTFYAWSTGAVTNCITVNSAGAYGVTVTDANGCTSSCSTTITVNPLPPCTITGTLSICEGQSTELCVAAGEGAYLWSNGETTNCTTVSTAGLFSVTVTDASGCTSSCSVTVDINPLPLCSITGLLFICQEGQNTELCATAGASSYLWSTEETSACITVNSAGNYSVTITDANGCTNVCSETVVVDALPVCTITGDVSICLGLSTELCVPPGALSYMWSTDEVTNCISVSAAGTYSVTITSIDGCVSTCSTSVAVNPLPVCSITGDSVLCLGESTVLCAAVGAAAYAWSTGEITSCINVISPGLYSVTITDINGCTSECSQLVTVNPLPVCLITGDSLLCQGESIELCVAAGADAYAWSNGEITNCITVNSAGLYSVTITDINGCTSECSQLVSVNPLPACLITGDDLLCEGDSTELCVAAGAAAYAWSNGEITNCITVDSAGLYTVTITDLNGCPLAPPAITCPVDVTIDCEDSTLPANTGNATATGTCDLIPTISFVDVLTQGLCPQEFTITRTWTASYPGGPSTVCTQMISVVDDTAPILVCPPNVTLECDESPLPANTGFATATDNCGILLTIGFSDVTSSGICPILSVTTRTWTATDECGNSASCIQIISVIDNTPPFIEIVNPLLSANGDTTYVQCYGQDPLWDLPLFDENSVVATDLCLGEVNINYNQVLLDQGDCEEDGYIVLFRLTWTATDICGNSSSAFVFFALVDTIPPVIYGVPADTTVNCNDIPELPDLVYATDECLCACLVLEQETEIPAGCQDGAILLRIWTATDDCGNETIVTQRITLVDDQGPAFVVVEPEMSGMTDGFILEYTCDDTPRFLDLLDATSVAGIGTCGGGEITITLRVNSEEALNCDFSGYLEQQTYVWTAVDECGISSTFTLIARLVDHEAPTLVGIPDFMICFDDPALRNIYATDNCEEAYTQFWDVNIPNPCGAGMAVRRTYEATDDCGNASRATVILLPEDFIAPILVFDNPLILDLEDGEILVIDCEVTGGRYTTFSANDVYVIDSCAAGVVVTFTERVMSIEDCEAGEVVATVELKWQATDVCGNYTERIVIAHVVDKSNPVFVNFQPSVTIGCNDALPAIFATDNCGEVTIIYSDSTILGDCDYEYVIRRIITATDACGNQTTRIQIVNVGGGGPVITGVEPEICDDLTIPIVTAYDACAEVFVDVTMTQDTVDIDCRDGLVIRRTWTAVDVCGNISVIEQIIVMNDQTPPEILIPSGSLLHNIIEHHLDVMRFSQTSLIDLINGFNERSVIVIDACDEDITPVFTVDILFGDCIEDGFSERRTYTWVATDICGNSASISVTIYLIDDVPPVMPLIDSDTTIVCEPLPEPPFINIGELDGTIVTFIEVITSGSNPNEFIVTRTWTATDSCGNSSTVEQVITWIPETYLDCEVLLPATVDCNSHGVFIGSIVTGGMGAYTYEWEVFGEKCFIQGGQGTPTINIYVGWEDVKVILTVTDAFGCETMCMTVLSCDLTQISLAGVDGVINPMLNIAPGAQILENPSQPESNEPLEFLVWPNPTTGKITLNFDSSFEQDIQWSLTNFLGQEVLNEQFKAIRGMNIHEASLDHLGTGAYLMQVNTVYGMHSQIVVIIPVK